MTTVFGASRDYVDSQLASLAEPRRSNINRIIAVMNGMVGPAPEGTAVPPSLIGRLLGSASYSEDAVADAYWAGILASSRTRHRRDDRGLRQVGQLERLSQNQVRTHALFYSLLRSLCLHHPGGAKFDLDSRRYLLAVFVPVGGYVEAMRFQPEEIPGLGALVTDVLAGLSAVSLLDGSNTGSESYLETYFKSEAVVGEGIVFAPSLAGIDLYLWACGQGGMPLRRFLQPDPLNLATDEILAIVPGAALVYEQGQNNPSLHN